MYLLCYVPMFTIIDMAIIADFIVVRLKNSLRIRKFSFILSG